MTFMSIVTQGRALVLVLLGVCAASASTAATVQISPSASSIASGAAFSLDVIVSGLGDSAAPSLGAYDLELGFDATRVVFNSIEFGSGGVSQLDLSGFGSLTGFFATVSSVVFNEISLDDASDLDLFQPGQFPIARLFFTAVGDGDAAFTFSSGLLSDSAGAELAGALSGATVAIGSPVPLPAAAWLFLSALGVFGAPFMRRRRSESVGLV